MWRSIFLSTLFLWPAVVVGQSSQFVVTKAPVKDGVRATADLPDSQHKRNVGGSDGAGLCVYTSAWHAALWQSVTDMYGFRDWMRQRPGGSYPQKFDATIAAYCKEKGIPLPPYVQHTGGDEDVLRLALKTGRMVCVTYCGVDGSGRYGSEVIGHMVNLVYLDDARAAILDNNFPGTFLWMSRADFLARWRGIKPDGSAFMGRDRWGRSFPIGGGWAIILLGAPPAPYPDRPAVQSRVSEPISRPPVLVGQCRNGQCVLPSTATGPAPLGTPPTQDHEWGQFDNKVWGWKLKDAPVIVADAPLKDGVEFPRDGVDASKMNVERTYSHNGDPLTKEEFTAVLSLADDSERWNLAIVGEPAFATKVRSDVAALPAATRAKLHVQSYAGDDWPILQFKLASGVTLRKPAVARVGADIGMVAVADYSLGRLLDLLGSNDGPTPRPAPAPLPKPKEPEPVKPSPVIPDVMPGPVNPTPVPAGPQKTEIPAWLLALILGGFILIIRK